MKFYAFDDFVCRRFEAIGISQCAMLDNIGGDYYFGTGKVSSLCKSIMGMM